MTSFFVDMFIYTQQHSSTCIQSIHIFTPQIHYSSIKNIADDIKQTEPSDVNDKISSTCRSHDQVLSPFFMDVATYATLIRVTNNTTDADTTYHA